MATRDDPYSRLYHRFADEFPNVYDDDRAYAAWCRLLTIADAAWPTRPPLPAAVNRKALAVLQGAGLVLVERGHYTVKGLAKEREQRTRMARESANARWSHSERTAPAMRPHSERTPVALLDETRLDETRRAERARDGLANITDPIARVWEQASGRSVLGSGSFAQDYLDDAARRHDESEVVTAIHKARRTFEGIPSTQQLTVAVRALLDPFPDSKAVAKDDEAEREQVRHRRAVENTLRRNHEVGGHADEPDPRCPACQGKGNVA